MGKALENWKEIVILSKLDDKNKKKLLGGLQRFYDGCMKDKVRRINHKFYLTWSYIRYLHKTSYDKKWKIFKA